MTPDQDNPLANRPGRGESILPFAPQRVPYRHTHDHAMMILHVALRHGFHGDRPPITPSTVRVLDNTIRRGIEIVKRHEDNRPSTLRGTFHGILSVAFHFEDHRMVADGWIVDESELDYIEFERLKAQASASRLKNGTPTGRDIVDLLSNALQTHAHDQQD